MSYQFLRTRREGAVEYLTLHRPAVRNAFNETVIAELTAWARALSSDPSVRAGVLAGEGPVFSAGADAAWMAKMAGYSREENARDAAAMAEMFLTLDTLPCVLIGRIHGAALGGGAGLAAVCDVVVAEAQTVFGFTEVKLGILPAVISPYVLAKIGRSAARELFLTGRRFDAEQARHIGLAHAVVLDEQLDEAVETYVSEVLSASPTGVAAAKRLIPQVWTRSAADAASLTADAIAAQRVSPEGQEGLTAFLSRRTPAWTIPRQ